MSKKQDQIDAIEVMNKLSDVDPLENYKDYKHSFWDLESIKVEIINLNKSIIRYHKYINYNRSSYDSPYKITIKLGFVDKFLRKTLDQKIDQRITKLKASLYKENEKEKMIIDLKRKYNPEY